MLCLLETFRKTEKSGRSEIYGKYLCKCGKTKECRTSSVKTGNTTSCGCVALKLRTKHGLSKIPEYEVHGAMLSRCQNPRDKKYYLYGGRGIRVCSAWQNPGGFVNFYCDMGPRPSAKHSIDRIDPNRDYEPNNCRWATIDIQNNNYSRSIRVEFRGKLMLLNEIRDLIGVSRGTLYYKYRNKTLTKFLEQYK